MAGIIGRTEMPTRAVLAAAKPPPLTEAIIDLENIVYNMRISERQQLVPLYFLSDYI